MLTLCKTILRGNAASLVVGEWRLHECEHI